MLFSARLWGVDSLSVLDDYTFRIVLERNVWVDPRTAWPVFFPKHLSDQLRRLGVAVEIRPVESHGLARGPDLCRRSLDRDGRWASAPLVEIAGPWRAFALADT